jgi:hypothetical protein
MNHIAQVADQETTSTQSGGKCYHYVKTHVGDALGIGFQGMQDIITPEYELNATDFARWVDDPNSAAQDEGFVESHADPSNPPLGAILVYQAGGACNLPPPGHIEVFVGNDTAVSDFRWPGLANRVQQCGAPRVFVLTKDRCL